MKTLNFTLYNVTPTDESKRKIALFVHRSSFTTIFGSTWAGFRQNQKQKCRNGSHIDIRLNSELYILELL